MASRKKKTNNVVKYRKPIKVNVGLIIFVCIFIFIVRCVVSYFSAENITGYEVKEGSLYTDNTYRGIILRDEKVYNSNHAGYVNYYARENERVACGNLVYILDETGDLKEVISAANLGENSLKNEDLRDLKIDITSFIHTFQNDSFYKVYDFKRSITGNVLKLANQTLMSDLGALGSASNGVSMVNAIESGIVTFWVDGYESLKSSDISEDMFMEENYKKETFDNNRIITAGEPVYKICSEENWSVVVPIEEKRGQEIEKEEYVKVRFLKNLYESWGKATLLHNQDGNTYLQLDFTNSMITFSKDRFIDIEIITETETGLKIPNSAIVQKEFFIVPKDYIVKGGNKDQQGVLKQIYLENGSPSTEFIETTIYAETEEGYYLDNSLLEVGNVLIKTDSTETFVLSKVGTLVGVYNINKGYADFKEIQILYQNEEYAIVRANSQYSLNVYDYIALNGDSVTDDQFIYE